MTQIHTRTGFLFLQHAPAHGDAAPGLPRQAIKAACAGYAGAFDVTLELMNHIVSGNLPDIPELRAYRLVPIKKKGTVDGVRPIAVGEVWLRLAAICAMEACPTKGSSLLPYQFGVGCQEVHNVWGML